MPGKVVFNQEQGLFSEGTFLLIPYFILLCYTSRSKSLKEEIL